MRYWGRELWLRLALIGAMASGTPSASRAASLQELFEGEFLPAGNCWFDSWELVSADATSGATLNFDAMSVNSLVDQPGNPGLQFNFGQQLTITGAQAIDLTFRFKVHAVANANSFAAHSLNLTGLNFVGPGGIAIVSQEVVDVNGGDLGPAVAIADNVNDVFQFNDAKNIAPHLNLSVTMNLFLSGLTAADLFSLTAFTQRFSQTGPASVAGDFNGDRTVDGADFLRWQRGLSPTPMSSLDLTAWRNNFGKSIVATPAVGAVPEPGGCGLLLAGITAAGWRKRASVRTHTSDWIKLD